MASAPSEFRVGQPVPLTVALADLGGPLQHLLSHGHLKATLEKHKVGKVEMDEIMKIAASTAGDIVEAK